MKMAEIVQITTNKYPNNVAYQFMGKGTSYSEFVMQIDKVAKAFVIKFHYKM